MSGGGETAPVGLASRLVAESVGTAFLLAAVVGSGIMAERLAGGNDALALLANAIATGAALVALIATFGPISGAHFNPLVSLALVVGGALPRGHLVPYVAAQVAGALAGVLLAHLMFDLPLLQLGAKERAGLGQWTGEILATLGLLLVVESGRRWSAAALPASVAAYITAAYWFTSSTSFANPAVTIARGFTDTFAGIGPGNVPAFVAAQLAGTGAALLLFHCLGMSDDRTWRASAREPDERPARRDRGSSERDHRGDEATKRTVPRRQRAG